MNLSNAYLKNAAMDGGHFERTTFSGTNLEGASLDSAYLLGATFYEAHLKAAILMNAQAQGASFDGDMQFVYLNGAHLEGANLSGAIGLTSYLVSSATLDENTILPANVVHDLPEHRNSSR